jgi:hypothetical protein
MKNKKKQSKKIKGEKRVTPEEAIENKKDKIERLKFIIDLIKDRDIIEKLVVKFKNRKISMAFIGKNELKSADGIFFFETINNRKIALKFIECFGIPEMSFATIGKFLEDIITKEGYFAGVFQKGYKRKGLSYGKAHTLFLEYENEVFERFNNCNIWSDLVKDGMPYIQAMAIWQKYLKLPVNIYKY